MSEVTPEPTPAPEPAPAPAPEPSPASRFSRANLRRVALSALKAFVGASAAVVIAREATLGGLHPSDLEGVAFAAIIAGLDAVAKVAQVFLEDGSDA